ncbi:MAG: adenosylcobalamin-dependent ribonucleoside-diphosphate reductase [Planctomycetes bacterium]|nr:adenosylcobalamin-dependent ribonucleoside-diphosphate reductase [Planctomycetota bacterium]
MPPSLPLFTRPPQPGEWTANARKVFESRYLMKDERGAVCEAPEDLLARVAGAVAGAELLFREGSEEKARRWAEVFYRLMLERIFLPNSPTLMNAGRELGMLSACFVLPVEDSIEGIFEAIKHTALIQKCGGGTGFDFSRLRPMGDRVKTSGGQSSGPISFMRVFSQASNAIQQGAFRRGANMGILRVDHPDILEFISSKRNLAELTNFNLSISVTDAFMDDIVSQPDKAHQVRNPRTGEWSPLRREGRTWTVGEVYERIVDETWQTGEPGLLFLDRLNADNPTPQMGRLEATNPCGEQPLLPFESCNLGSINLSRFALGGGSGGALDWQAFDQTVEQAIRFLDNVVEISRSPVAATDAISRANRKIGLGLMGLADTLFLLQIPYNSSAAIEFGEQVMTRLDDAAHRASEALAGERGVFPNWKGSRWEVEKHRPMRNAAVTTVAPTGTISILADCSPGIEPVYALVFHRHILDGQRLLEVNKHFLRAAREQGFYSPELMERIAREGSIAGITAIPAETRRVFVCARDLAPIWHLRMQAAFQRHCDASISKTINLPSGASREEVRAMYLEAYRQGLKGVTVYRDRSRENQPMAAEEIGYCGMPFCQE